MTSPTRPLTAAWVCRPCAVEGLDPEGPDATPPVCWNCGGVVVVTSRLQPPGEWLS